MKYILTYLFLSPFLVFSQQKYFIYEYNKQYGIVSNDGTSIIDSKYKELEDYKTIDSLAILKNEKGKTLLFHLFNGTFEEYDQISTNEVYLENEYFSLIKNNGKQFLKGEKTNTIISLDKNFTSIKNLGPNYVIVTSDTDVTKKTTVNVEKFELKKGYVSSKDKKGYPLPPPDPKKNPIAYNKVIKKEIKNITYRKNFFIYTNSKKLQFIKELNAESSLAKVYKIVTKENKKTYDSIAYNSQENYENINPWDHFLYENFDYLVLCDDWYFIEPAISLFDSQFKSKNSFNYTKNREGFSQELEDAIEKKLKISSKTIDVELAEYTISPMAYSERQERKEFLLIENIEGLNVVSYLDNNNYVFMFKTPYKVKQYDRKNKGIIRYQIEIMDDNNNKIISLLDNKNPKLNIPTNYLNLFKIDYKK
ncbi:WG repeat protein [Flavobacterium branchiophilum]|uniref:WG repeat protein n=1 Tax=Flavobacterium branchiophilum (strain FL-15) TaxID=1034807 RepID=G2Z0F0_FLABF|nr:hypothetical protein [Flavobacterium branchiophilum]CCB69341.1 Hypothetical protein FBFL15_1257 [Flavobacterium branchiophilum FL-15]